MENRDADHTGGKDNLYAFFSLSLSRISSIIFPSSRQMDKWSGTKIKLLIIVRNL